jgi:glycosyltransferase involved in cell wall biosynthesis
VTDFLRRPRCGAGGACNDVRVPGRRLLVISHPAVVNVNQEVYRELARRAWDVTIVLPSRWRNEYSQGALRPVALAGLEGALRPTPVLLAGRPQRHLYLTRPRAVCARVRPDVAFVEAEAFALAAMQWSRAFAKLGIPFGVQCYENIDRHLPLPVRTQRGRVLRSAAFVAARSDTAGRLVRSWGATGEVALVPPAVPAWDRAPAVSFAGTAASGSALASTAPGSVPPATSTPAATASPALSTQAPPAPPVVSGPPAAASAPRPSRLPTSTQAVADPPGRPAAADLPVGSERPFTVGYAGRLIESKGLLDLLAAVRKLEAPVEMILIGNGELRSRLDGEPIPGSRVRVLDGLRHDQMAAGYAQLDVLVLPSRTAATWKEQFGRVVVEALWCGVPVVGSDSGEIPWLIGLTGGGLVFPEGDSEALAGRLQELRDAPDLRRQLALAGRAAVERLFSVPAATDSLERLLTVALERSPLTG